ncbi:MAG: hypothetical protein EBY09_13680, partial [Verrucomicrobia bacterium]|nr:hypothetical protein [Verrucomicrobiota bacterium]NDE99423.1 hypothetical protein [Verrucomicrobiota bacterium]
MRRLTQLLAVALLLAVSARAAAPFELKDGDRVIFLGDTLIEREQHYGWIELMLTTRFPDRNVTFRNLGWSADLPNGESRLGLSLTQAGNEPEGEAWKLLQKQIEETKPTVAFIGYGMAASFAGEAGLPKFKEDYNRLLDAIEKISPGCRFVLLSPIKHEKLPAPLPDPTKHNEQIEKTSAVIRLIASDRKVPFVDLSLEAPTPQGLTMNIGGRPTKPLPAITENGIHLTQEGYKQVAVRIQHQLGLASGLQGLVRIAVAPSEPLRQVILRKNEFYFHRSRPANMAYIFGFRKREQGKNAVEMPQFDPLIAAEEKKIRELCKHLNDASF